MTWLPSRNKAFTTAFTLLDLSADFDTVNHICFSWIVCFVVLSGVALRWFKYLVVLRGVNYHKPDTILGLRE